MSDYTETVTKLRDVYRAYVVTGNEKAGQFLADAAAAIEALETEIRESMQKCAECGDEQEQKVKELQARLGEAENSAERWKDMYLTKQLPKRGEWVRKEGELTYWYECSERGYRPHIENYPYLSDFCPNCGAKMEVQDGQE